MGYVALSRVRSLRGIRLLGLNKRALQINTEVLEFDKELRRKSEEAVRLLMPYSYLQRQVQQIESLRRMKKKDNSVQQQFDHYTQLQMQL